MGYHTSRYLYRRQVLTSELYCCQIKTSFTNLALVNIYRVRPEAIFYLESFNTMPCIRESSFVKRFYLSISVEIVNNQIIAASFAKGFWILLVVRVTQITKRARWLCTVGLELGNSPFHQCKNDNYETFQHSHKNYFNFKITNLSLNFYLVSELPCFEIVSAIVVFSLQTCLVKIFQNPLVSEEIVFHLAR